MARRMAQTVVLRDPSTSTPVVLVAGAECPAWAEQEITNEDVFEPRQKEQSEKPARAERARRSRPAGE